VDLLDLLASSSPSVAQEAHHLRICVEFDLVLQVLLRERNERETFGVKHCLAHKAMLPE
jgi:hypothetical protein